MKDPGVESPSSVPSTRADRATSAPGQREAVVDGELVCRWRWRCPPLAEEFGTPLFIYDEEHLRARARRGSRCLWRGCGMRDEGVLVYKAMAALVAEEGMQVDVATGGELDVVAAAGVDPARVVFHGNNKSDFEISSLLERGVGRIVVDSFDEIDRLRQLKPRTTDVAAERSSVRATPGVNAHTHGIHHDGARRIRSSGFLGRIRRSGCRYRSCASRRSRG